MTGRARRAAANVAAGVYAAVAVGVVFAILLRLLDGLAADIETVAALIGVPVFAGVWAAFEWGRS